MSGSRIRIGKITAMEHERDKRFISVSAGGAKSPSWLALLFGLFPFVAICFSVNLWDRIYPVVAGLPFNIFWLILWTLLTPLCMWAAYRCERRSATENPHLLHPGQQKDQQ